MHRHAAFACIWSGSNFHRVCRMRTASIYLLLLCDRKWKLFTECEATLQRLRDNRSVPGSSWTHRTTNGGKWVRLHKRAPERCRLTLVCSQRWQSDRDEPAYRNPMSVFLGKLIAQTFLLISPSKPKKKLIAFAVRRKSADLPVQLLNRL